MGDSPAGSGELIEQVQREFRTTEGQAGCDVDSFITACAHRNLLQ